VKSEKAEITIIII